MPGQAIVDLALHPTRVHGEPLPHSGLRVHGTKAAFGRASVQVRMGEPPVVRDARVSACLGATVPAAALRPSGGRWLPPRRRSGEPRRGTGRPRSCGMAAGLCGRSGTRAGKLEASGPRSARTAAHGKTRPAGGNQRPRIREGQGPGGWRRCPMRAADRELEAKAEGPEAAGEPRHSVVACPNRARRSAPLRRNTAGTPPAEPGLNIGPAPATRRRVISYRTVADCLQPKQRPCRARPRTTGRLSAGRSAIESRHEDMARRR